jgi:hypothetical protein
MSIENEEFEFEPVTIEISDEYYNKYLLARPLNFHRMSTAPEVDAVVNHLLEVIGYTKTQRNKAFKAMRMLVCDLYHNYVGCKERYLRLNMSKNSGKFKLIWRYNKYEINYQPLCKCLLGLIMNRYVVRKKGYFNFDFKDGYQTRIRARKKLIELMESFGVREEMITEYPDQELIIKRIHVDTVMVTHKGTDKKVRHYPVKIKQLIDYPDNEMTNRWRNTLKAYNALLAKTYIDVDSKGYVPEGGRQILIDLSNKRVRRYFSNGTFTLTGRFFGGFWQMLPEDLRERIIINGRIVHEIDFSGMLVHILYAMEGLKLGEKLPYVVSKDNDPENKRPFYKRLFLVAVNAKSKKSTIEVVLREIKKKPNRYPQLDCGEDELKRRLWKMLYELIDHHKLVEKYISSGAGLRSQFIDSQIAYKVIANMTRAKIPVLCIHDSFICRDWDADIVKQQMKDAYVSEINSLLQKNKHELRVTEQDVITTETSLIEKLPKYRTQDRDKWFHEYNAVFSHKNEQYVRQRKYSSKGKTDFNVTVRVT